MDCRYQVEVNNNVASIRAGLNLLSKQTYMWEDGSAVIHMFDRVCWLIKPEADSNIFLFIDNGIYRPEASRTPLDRRYKMLFLENIGKL